MTDGLVPPRCAARTCSPTGSRPKPAPAPRRPSRPRPAPAPSRADRRPRRAEQAAARARERAAELDGHHDRVVARLRAAADVLTRAGAALGPEIGEVTWQR
ncbi:hypothetical protein GCM10010492_65120 [Saccharothrix mutabilis subsp. mutabilis]|uniref:Uncharacterized protein n=1 Tax=Saccharothrix mutabilis subsp. mutabilis TaxID=66855 RepID=A0ABN0UMB0_9PSEU